MAGANTFSQIHVYSPSSNKKKIECTKINSIVTYNRIMNDKRADALYASI